MVDARLDVAPFPTSLLRPIGLLLDNLSMADSDFTSCFLSFASFTYTFPLYDHAPFNLSALKDLRALYS